MELTLPFPPSILSPNARPHWAAKAKAAKAYRHECFVACRIAGLILPETDGKLHLWIDFYPPSGRKYDDDGLLSRFKSGRDGMADYLGIDDVRFVSHPWVKEKMPPNGCIKIRITAGPT
jgi:crossover junction endodeoxyribonuclease RusA